MTFPAPPEAPRELRTSELLKWAATYFEGVAETGISMGAAAAAGLIMEIADELSNRAVAMETGVELYEAKAFFALAELFRVLEVKS